MRGRRAVKRLVRQEALAAGIPGTRLVLLSGDASPPFVGATAEVSRAVDGFLKERNPAAFER